MAIVLGGNHPGGNHPGGNHPGGNHPGGSYPSCNCPVTVHTSGLSFDQSAISKAQMVKNSFTLG